MQIKAIGWNTKLCYNDFTHKISTNSAMLQLITTALQHEDEDIVRLLRETSL